MEPNGTIQGSFYAKIVISFFSWSIYYFSFEVLPALMTTKPTGKNKKRFLISEETNSNDTTKRNKGATCLICNNVVRETQQAIFCEGTCKQ